MGEESKENGKVIKIMENKPNKKEFLLLEEQG